MSVSARAREVALLASLRRAFDDVTGFLLEECGEDVAWEDAHPELDALRNSLSERVEAMFTELWPGLTMNDPAVLAEIGE